MTGRLPGAALRGTLRRGREGRVFGRPSRECIVAAERQSRRSSAPADRTPVPLAPLKSTATLRPKLGSWGAEIRAGGRARSRGETRARRGTGSSSAKARVSVAADGIPNLLLKPRRSPPQSEAERSAGRPTDAACSRPFLFLLKAPRSGAEAKRTGGVGTGSSSAEARRPL